MENNYKRLAAKILQKQSYNNLLPPNVTDEETGRFVASVESALEIVKSSAK